MVSVSEATDIIFANRYTPELYDEPLVTSIGKVLGETVYADRDFPPFDRVSMDGIAINFDAFRKGNTSFFIEGVQPAGVAQKKLTSDVHCLEVMTGAILPSGTDTVVRYEDIKIEEGKNTEFKKKGGSML